MMRPVIILSPQKPLSTTIPLPNSIRFRAGRLYHHHRQANSSTVTVCPRRPRATCFSSHPYTPQVSSATVLVRPRPASLPLAGTVNKATGHAARLEIPVDVPARIIPNNVLFHRSVGPCRAAACLTSTAPPSFHRSTSVTSCPGFAQTRLL
ncbi:hypothetical protein BDV95DRAFT_574463 [Massariosphaeria phaeospora]|uniref:Uncharacterized protein n=1 Tax=Massariosphaeria phaeospora TaxID=100035 RepID=A0A7C8IDY1_9PLEO|nr:hypothetical protein BDV95DRAFT_574463 [Massariosphaeria phaeospora]